MHQEIISFENVVANLNTDNSSLIYVLPMLDDLRDMRSIYNPDDDGISLHWGLYQGDNIDKVAEDQLLLLELRAEPGHGREQSPGEQLAGLARV